MRISHHQPPAFQHKRQPANNRCVQRNAQKNKMYQKLTMASEKFMTVPVIAGNATSLASMNSEYFGTIEQDRNIKQTIATKCDAKIPVICKIGGRKFAD